MPRPVRGHSVNAECLGILNILEQPQEDRANPLSRRPQSQPPLTELLRSLETQFSLKESILSPQTPWSGFPMSCVSRFQSFCQINPAKYLTFSGKAFEKSRLVRRLYKRP